MITDQINFSRQLIKGRVAEIVFEQLLRDAGCFTVLSFGYENTLPELMHQQRDMNTESTMEIIRHAPDFVVINKETHDVHLIEVKFRRHMTTDGVMKDAERMFEAWKPSYLFIATPEAFYFGKVAEIVKNKGRISPLKHPNIPKALQQKYIDLLNEFLSSEGGN